MDEVKKPTRFIVSCDEAHTLAECGGKAYALWRLREEGFPVPEWFALSPTAFDAGVLKSEARTGLQSALARLGLNDSPLAVRSSSVEEDAAVSSFAGQFESYLGVGADALEKHIEKVWKSGYAQRVAAYKGARGEDEGFKPPAVMVQRLVDADVAGVAFSVDPVSANWDRSLVSSVLGLGSTLVDGESDADRFVVDRLGTVLEKEIGHKHLKRRLRGGTPYSIIECKPKDTEAKQASLNAEQAQEVAALARRCEIYFGRPQDIEWAIKDGILYLLQSRPITTLHQVVDDSGKLYIWDNSNIAESYSGITLPLTFSFARYIYTEVYRQFCLLLKVSPKRVTRHRALFGQMLGLVRGRVYYNLLSWYKVLALLPGYSLNQGFMEQMMGVKEPLSPEAQKEVDKVRSTDSKVLDAWYLLRSMTGLLWKHWTIEGDVSRFYKRLETSLGSLERPLEEMRLEELADHFHDLERDLLTSWDAPLVNDFIAMVFFGLLKNQCSKWIGDGSGSLHNELICDMGNIVSAEPAKRMQKMATIASGNDRLVEVLRSGSHGEIRRALSENQQLKVEVESYFAKFGDRCLDELKLESFALVDDPMPLYRSIGELALHKESLSGDESARSKKDRRLSDAEERAFSGLKGNPVQKIVFRYVLKHARRRVSGRENLRFERTRLFGRIRRIFLEMGKRLSAFNVIDDPRDIFYLEIYEIIGYIEGNGVTVALRELIELRKSEFSEYEAEEGPDDRFETKGAVPIANRFRNNPEAAGRQAINGDLEGIGCCPGQVRGIARVVKDPQSAQLKKGEILVAKQTDPGWIMLFPLAAGLLVERGSLLSHSAIVSRELGLPAVVSVKGLLDTIQTGDEVEFDGATGRIRIIESPNEAVETVDE